MKNDIKFGIRFNKQSWKGVSPLGNLRVGDTVQIQGTYTIYKILEIKKDSIVLKSFPEGEVKEFNKLIPVYWTDENVLEGAL